MIFSVLIPSVPSRHAQAIALFDKITKQSEGYDVEVLMFCDNKKRSIGKKREALVKISQGDYVAFVDDDDDVADCYISRICDEINTPNRFKPDVIVFDTWVTVNDGPKVLCRHDATHQNEPYSVDGFRRAPWQMHVWRGNVARYTPFPDMMYGEDWPWCEEMLKRVNVSTKINAALYHYRYSDAGTEALVEQSR
jgi:glycosyltransferase involved in cell wall biosynthesis